MATATTLDQAAAQAYNNLFPKWVAGAPLPASLLAFTNPLILNPDIFPEETPDFHPVSNWCALIQSITKQMISFVGPPFVPGQGISYALLNTAANYVYRMCWMTLFLQQHGFISAPQGAAVLAAYNAAF